LNGGHEEHPVFPSCIFDGDCAYSASFQPRSGAADQPVLLICNTQNRSRAVTEALKEQGFTNIRYVNGGMRELAKRGWPMVKPQDLLASGKS